MRFLNVTNEYGMAILAVALMALVGCGSNDAKVKKQGQTPTQDVNPPPPNQRQLSKSTRRIPPAKEAEPAKPPGTTEDEPQPGTRDADSLNPETGRPRILGDLLDDQEYVTEKMPIDEERLAAHGIRKLSSRHLTLFTDLPSTPDVDELPEVFDLAVPQWCEYFEIPAEKVKDWRLVGFVMKDEQRFRQGGAFPDDLPSFEWGYQRGHEFWLYEQPTIYYRRHLLLHEGTHGFMNWHLGGTGPMWFTEGTAELLGTHNWKDGTLTLRYNPKDNTEAEHWGRVKIIKDLFKKNRALSIESIFFMRRQGQLTNDVYAWCWAICSFFDQHPRWQRAFRDMSKHCATNGDEFTWIFKRAIKDDLLEINEQWQLYVTNIEYGYDVARAAVDYQRGQPVPASGATAIVAADRGWQSSGFRIDEGRTYEITATGRYVIGADPKPWLCEAGGVTIRYNDGHPLGILVGAIRDDDEPLIDNATPLAHFEVIGLGRTIQCKRSGTLYIRINESAADLADNQGQLTVRIVPKS